MNRGRWGSWARLVVIVVVAAAVSTPPGAAPVPHPEVAAPPAPATPHPGWRVTPAAEPTCRAWPEGGPSIAHFNAVAASGPDDAWAVGLCQTADQGCGPEGRGCGNKNLDAPDLGIVQHWDGRNWHQVPVPDTEGFDSVVAFAEDDVWVGSNDGPLHWNGRRWSSRAQGLTGRWGKNLGLSGGHPGNLWGFDRDARLYRWTGRRWQRVRLPAGWHVTPGASEITAGAATDLWVRGMSTEVDEWAGAGTFRDAHYDGRRWRLLPKPPQGHTVTEIAVVGRDTWAALTSENPSRTTLARWNGHQWARRSAPGRIEGLEAMAGDGQGGMWLLTAPGHIQEIWHWNRRTWTALELSRELTARTATVHALAHVPGTTAVWGVGQAGTNNVRDEQPFIETTGHEAPPGQIPRGTSSSPRRLGRNPPNLGIGRRPGAGRPSSHEHSSNGDGGSRRPGERVDATRAGGVRSDVEDRHVEREVPRRPGRQFRRSDADPAMVVPWRGEPAVRRRARRRWPA